MGCAQSGVKDAEKPLDRSQPKQSSEYQTNSSTAEDHPTDLDSGVSGKVSLRNADGEVTNGDGANRASSSIGNENEGVQNPVDAVLQTKSLTTGRAAGLKHIGFGPFKKENQDEFFVQIGNFGGREYGHLFAVFDGHGTHGKTAAQYCREVLPVILDEELRQYFARSPSDAVMQHSVTELISDVFVETERRLQEAAAQSGVDLSSSGTTATVVYVDSNRCWAAAVGDSRVILCSVSQQSWSEQALTLDHRPSRATERARVEAAGGRVEPKRLPDGHTVGEPRVWLQHLPSPGLLLSRSLGDMTASSVGCTSEPEVSYCTLRPQQDMFLVLGSDGVWDVLPNRQVCDMVAKAADPERGCMSVLEMALAEWEDRMAADNVTVLVAEFLWNEAVNPQTPQVDDGTHMDSVDSAPLPHGYSADASAYPASRRDSEDRSIHPDTPPRILSLGPDQTSHIVGPAPAPARGASKSFNTMDSLPGEVDGPVLPPQSATPPRSPKSPNLERASDAVERPATAEHRAGSTRASWDGQGPVAGSRAGSVLGPWQAQERQGTGQAQAAPLSDKAERLSSHVGGQAAQTGGPNGPIASTPLNDKGWAQPRRAGSRLPPMRVNRPATGPQDEQPQPEAMTGSSPPLRPLPVPLPIKLSPAPNSLTNRALAMESFRASELPQASPHMNKPSPPVQASSRTLVKSGSKTADRPEAKDGLVQEPEPADTEVPREQTVSPVTKTVTSKPADTARKGHLHHVQAKAGFR